VPNNGRVPHVEMGSNRVYTMRVRGEANVRDTALVCQLKTHSVPFCRFSALSSSAEFCRIMPISASSRTIGASVVLYNNDIHDKYTMTNRKPEH